MSIMTFSHMSHMFSSETEGWLDVMRLHPTVKRLLLFFVVPMSLIPSLMYAYAELVTPGSVLPHMQPGLSLYETLVAGSLFCATEVAMVLWMAVVIQGVSERFATAPTFERAFTLAAIAPTPLWLAPVALFIPSMWVNLAVGLLAWVGSVALIRHGVRPILGLEDPAVARRVANTVTFAGVVAWLAMIVILTALLSLIVGLR